MATVTASAIAGIDDPFEGDAHTFLMAVYKNRAHDLSVRIDAAKAAIRYEKPALANIDAQHSGPDGGSISFTWEPPVEP